MDNRPPHAAASLRNHKKTVSSCRSLGEEFGGEHIYIMINFAEWLADRDVTTFLRLLESADYFNPQTYNVAFNKELGGLDRLRDPSARAN